MTAERSEKLDMCPICQKSYWVLTKHVPDLEHAQPGWRCSCHGCSVATLRCTTRTEALNVYRSFMMRVHSRLMPVGAANNANIQSASA